MDRQQLLIYYSSRPSVISISSRIAEPGTQHIHLNGLIGSSQAMIMAAVSSHGNQSHVVILNDGEEAAYFLNDIENILGGDL